MRYRFAMHGDIRQRKGFLWFPKWRHGWIRWLEHASWEEYFEGGEGWTFRQWTDL